MVDIDILIGNDYYYEFIGEEQTRCSNGVVLLASPFGFVAGGSLRNEGHHRNYHSSFFIHASRELESQIEIERFWSLEDIGIKDKCYQDDDERALQIFNKSVKFQDNRYIVQWPWKENLPDLTDNYGLAFGRLKSLMHRVKSNDDLLMAYDKPIRDQREHGIIEVAPEMPEGTVHYIPHHCVINPAKKTTKLRIVYDASAKVTKNALSPNDCLYRGPVFLANSVGIILRWRLPGIALISDIEKAFRQVGLQPAHRDVARFLWVKELDKPPRAGNLQVYRFCRAPFGFISSPFLLAATILHHVKSQNTSISSEIANNVYVDNIFGGRESKEDAYDLYVATKNIFGSASMNVREWYLNSREFLQMIADKDRGEGRKTSVLGLQWDLETDKFHISVGKPQNDMRQWTKRQVLQMIASVFDPCGFLGAVIIRGKMLMQSLWKDKHEWDVSLPAELNNAWLFLLDDLKRGPEVSITRKVSEVPFSINNHYEIHCFCDASSKAYAAVVYLRSTTGNNDTASVDLLYAKTRVSPLKPITIPRLELMAAVIGIRCLKFIEEELKTPIAQKFLWTDSSCVLHWISKNPVSAVFVQNRLREIRALPKVDFQFVCSAENPADMASRGTTLPELRDSSLWWHGPSWLTRDSSTWPRQLELANKSEVLEKEPDICLTSTEATIYETLLELNRFFCLQMLYRVTAYVFRFIKRLQKKPFNWNGEIHAQEIESAKRYWDKQVQRQLLSGCFGPDGKHTTNSIRLSLCPFVDSHGLIRCRGRYLNPNSGDETTFPKLLPKYHEYTDLVIRDCHEKLLHAGVKHTLAEFRNEYWVIHGRNQIKRVLKECRICRYYSK